MSRMNKVNQALIVRTQHYSTLANWNSEKRSAKSAKVPAHIRKMQAQRQSKD